LISEIEALLYSSSDVEKFFRSVLNEIRAGDVDGLFHEALVKLDALGILDAELDEFVNDFTRDQIKRFYQDLYKTRRWHLINGHVYTYSDVLRFVDDSRKLIKLLREKVERIYQQACEATQEFNRTANSQQKEVEHSLPCGNGILMIQQP
jgi:hypothetical protein